MKVTIRAEPISNDHIEPYTTSPINMNYTLLEEKEDVSVREFAT